MKLKTFFICLLLSCFIGSCNSSVESKADKMLKRATEYAFSRSSGQEVTIENKEFIFVAPDDSLAVIKFDGKIEGMGKVSMYFTYVISDSKGDDYWILDSKNPVAGAYRTNEILDSAYKYDKESINTALRINSIMALMSGKGKRVKDTKK